VRNNLALEFVILKAILITEM